MKSYLKGDDVLEKTSEVHGGKHMIVGDNFFVDSEDWEFGIWCAKENKPLLLIGETGTGKTQFARAIARVLGLRFYYINVGAGTDAKASFVGVMHLDLDGNDGSRGTVFVESEFLRGIADKDGLVCIDELGRAPTETANYLYSLVGNEEVDQIAVDDSRPPRVVKRKAPLFATSNSLGSFEYTVRRFDRALLDRWYVLHFRLPPPELMIKILVAKTGCSIDVADKIVNFSDELQTQHKKGELSTSVSTRMLLRAADAANRFKLSKALEVSITNIYQEPNERILIKQIMQKY